MFEACFLNIFVTPSSKVQRQRSVNKRWWMVPMNQWWMTRKNWTWTCPLRIVHHKMKRCQSGRSQRSPGVPRLQASYQRHLMQMTRQMFQMKMEAIQVAPRVLHLPQQVPQVHRQVAQALVQQAQVPAHQVVLVAQVPQALLQAPLQAVQHLQVPAAQALQRVHQAARPSPQHLQALAVLPRQHPKHLPQVPRVLRSQVQQAHWSPTWHGISRNIMSPYQKSLIFGLMVEISS